MHVNLITYSCFSFTNNFENTRQKLFPFANVLYPFFKIYFSPFSYRLATAQGTTSEKLVKECWSMRKWETFVSLVKCNSIRKFETLFDNYFRSQEKGMMEAMLGDEKRKLKILKQPVVCSKSKFNAFLTEWKVLCAKTFHFIRTRFLPHSPLLCEIFSMQKLLVAFHILRSQNEKQTMCWRLWMSSATKNPQTLLEKQRRKNRDSHKSQVLAGKSRINHCGGW